MRIFVYINFPLPICDKNKISGVYFMGIYAQKKQCLNLEFKHFVNSNLIVVQHLIQSEYHVSVYLEHLDDGRIQISFLHDQGYIPNRSTSDDVKASKALIIEALEQHGYSICKTLPLIVKQTKAGKIKLQDLYDSRLESQHHDNALVKIRFKVSHKTSGITEFTFCFVENTISINSTKVNTLVINPVNDSLIELQHLFHLSKFGYHNCVYFSTFLRDHFFTIEGSIEEEYANHIKPIIHKRPTAFKATLLVKDESYDLLYMGHKNLTLKHSVSGKPLSIHECFKQIGYDALNAFYASADKEQLVYHVKSSLFHYCKLTYPKFYFKEVSTVPGPNRHYTEILLLREFSGVAYWISFKASSITIRNQFSVKINPHLVFSAEKFSEITRIIKAYFGVNKPTMVELLADIFDINLIDSNNVEFVKNLYFYNRN